MKAISDHESETFQSSNEDNPQWLIAWRLMAGRSSVRILSSRPDMLCSWEKPSLPKFPYATPCNPLSSNVSPSGLEPEDLTAATRRQLRERSLHLPSDNYEEDFNCKSKQPIGRANTDEIQFLLRLNDLRMNWVGRTMGAIFLTLNFEYNV